MSGIGRIDFLKLTEQYKITEKNEQLLLIVWGSEDSVSTIGELAVCQMPLCRNCSLEIIQM